MKAENTTQPKKRRPKGTGSIFYIESRKRYAGQILVDVGNGNEKKKTVYGRTKTEVANRLKELERKSAAGEYIVKDKTNLYDFIEAMIEDQKAMNEIRPSTADRKLETLKMLSPLTDMTIQDITEDSVRDYFKTKLHYSQSVIEKLHQLLNWAFKKALRKEIITENPLTEFRVPKSKKPTVKVRGLTIKEQAKLLDHLKNNCVRYSEIMLISMFTGMRCGEVCALCVEDINIERKTISVSKTVARGKNGTPVIHSTKTAAGNRTLYINDDIANFLRNCIGDKEIGYLFLSSNGKYVTTQQVNYYYWTTIKSNNILDPSVYGKVNLHSLRHTFATRCIEGGMPAKVLQKILGHTDISITLNVYCDVFEKYENEHMAAASEYMKANNLAIA